MAIDYIKKRRGAANEVPSRNVLEYGSIDLSGATRCTDVINAAFEHAAERNNVEITFPRGIYKIDEPLYWPNGRPRISGEGDVSVILPDGQDYDWLTVGGGPGTGSVGPAGWVRDLIFRGPEIDAPSGFTAGLKLNNAQHIEVSNVWVDYAPIGFDFINNNYGTTFYNCRTTFSRCRIAVRLSGDRPGMSFASGSDINFFNCWFGGRDAAIWAERSGGGYNFFGGQVLSGGGLAAPDDTLGSLTINRNLEEVGTVGGRMSMRFFGTSFESAAKCWNVRIHDVASNPNGCQLLFHGVSFTGGVGGNAIGVLKLTNGYNDVIEWHGCALNGEYSRAAGPLDINVHPSTGRASFVEFGTQDFATFNGVSLNLNTTGMLVQSHNIRGFAVTPFHLLIPQGLMLKWEGGSFQRSSDWDSSWTAV